MTAADEFSALRAALDALNAECEKLKGDINRPPERTEISAHLAFMRECKPDVIGRLLAAAEERDRLRVAHHRTLDEVDKLVACCDRRIAERDAERARAEQLTQSADSIAQALSTARARAERLAGALRGVMDAIEAEAKATRKRKVAIDNFSDHAPEDRAYEKSLMVTMQAFADARAAIAVDAARAGGE